MGNQTATYDQSVLADLAGAVGANEFNGARTSTKPELWKWLNNLRTLTDADLFEQAQQWIFDSASCGRFRGGYSDVHCRASATWHEAIRRHISAGHDTDCRGETMYSRAYRAVVRSHGYETTPIGVCQCPTLNVDPKVGA